MDWQMLIATAKDLILAGAAITGSIVAVKGLSTWRRQLRGQAEYELAKRILKLTFQYRDAIYGVRNPFIWKYEMPDPPEEQAKNMSNDQKGFYSTSKAYDNRCNKVTEVRQALYPELLEAEVLWGKKIEEFFKVLFNLEKELYLYIRYFLKLKDPDILIDDKEPFKKIIRNKRDILYDSLSDDDQFRKDFSSGIEAIENLLKSHLNVKT